MWSTVAVQSPEPVTADVIPSEMEIELLKLKEKKACKMLHN